MTHQSYIFRLFITSFCLLITHTTGFSTQQTRSFYFEDQYQNEIFPMLETQGPSITGEVEVFPALITQGPSITNEVEVLPVSTTQDPFITDEVEALPMLTTQDLFIREGVEVFPVLITQITDEANIPKQDALRMDQTSWLLLKASFMSATLAYTSNLSRNLAFLSCVSNTLFTFMNWKDPSIQKALGNSSTLNWFAYHFVLSIAAGCSFTYVFFDMELIRNINMGIMTGHAIFKTSLYAYDWWNSKSYED